MIFRLALMFLLFFSAGFVHATQENEFSKTQNNLYSRIHALSPYERRYVVLATWEDVTKNSRNLKSDTYAQYIWSMKVVAVENMMLAKIADEAVWPEMAAVLNEWSVRMVDIINGKGKKGAAFDAEVADWMKRYDALLNQTRAKWPVESRRPASAEVMALRKALLTHVASTARIINASRPIKKKL